MLARPPILPVQYVHTHLHGELQETTSGVSLGVRTRQGRLRTTDAAVRLQVAGANGMRPTSGLWRR